jgi:hypothetical protein
LGRSSLLTPSILIRIIWSVAILGLLGALYGLYQQFVGYPSWDVTWINTKGYTALSLGSGVVRAFSTFSSAQEYAVFLSVSAVAWLALFTRATRWPMVLHFAGFATVVVALFYESQRTSVFLLGAGHGLRGGGATRPASDQRDAQRRRLRRALDCFAGSLGSSVAQPVGPRPAPAKYSSITR